MKRVFVLRHAQKNFLTGGITKKGEEDCENLRKLLPEFVLVISSEKKRTIDTAKHILMQDPEQDSKANIEHTTGTELVQLIKKTVKRLNDNENALIITHDPALCPAFLLLQHNSSDQEQVVFRALEGFIVDEKMDVKRFP